MVLGSDIGLEESVSLSLCDLVERISYKRLCHSDLTEWVHTTWRPIMGYAPEITRLTQDWLCFKFKTLEDTTTILEWLWTLDGGSLMLKIWRISFNPTHDYFLLRHF